MFNLIVVYFLNVTISLLFLLMWGDDWDMKRLEKDSYTGQDVSQRLRAYLLNRQKNFKSKAWLSKGRKLTAAVYVVFTRQLYLDADCYCTLWNFEHNFWYHFRQCIYFRAVIRYSHIFPILGTYCGCIWWQKTSTAKLVSTDWPITLSQFHLHLSMYLHTSLDTGFLFPYIKIMC